MKIIYTLYIYNILKSMIIQTLTKVFYFNILFPSFLPVKKILTMSHELWIKKDHVLRKTKWYNFMKGHKYCDQFYP